MSALPSKQFIFIRNLLLTTVLGGIVGILNYLFNILVARYTDQDIFSVFSAAIGIVYLIQIPAISIQSLITKEIAKNKGKDLNHYKWYSLAIFTLIGIFFSLIFFFFRNSISEIASIPNELVIFLAITMLFGFISPVSKGLLLGEERIITVNLVLLLETVLKFVIGAFAIQQGGLVWALILANSVPAMITTIAIIPFVKFKSSWDERVRMNFKDLAMMTVSFLLITIPFSLDLVLVNPSFRAEYSSISLLGKLIYFACITTSTVLFARLSNEDFVKDQKKSLIISLTLAGAIGLCMSLIYFVFGDLVISYTVGLEYVGIEKYIGVFGLCMTGFSLVYMTINYFISKGEYNYLWILLGTAVLQVLLFSFRNNSLDIVVENQIIVYVLLTLLIFFCLIFKLRKHS